VAARLVMSGDISDWLDELAADEPARARAVGAAFVELLSTLELAAAPGVTSLAELDSGPIDGAATLDSSYQELLDRMQQLRQQAALAATARSSIDQAMAALSDATDYGDVTDRLARLKEHRQTARSREAQITARCERLQAQLDDFRVRREMAKANYTAALAAVEIRQVLDEMSAADVAEAETALTDAKANLDATARAARALLTQADGRTGPADGLLELDLGGHADDQIRILLAEEPPGTAMLLAVLHGEEAIASHRSQAIDLASDLLDDMRAGSLGDLDDLDPDDSPLVEFDDATAFLAAFFPDNATDIEHDAATLAARLTLPQLRQHLGITEEDMAHRMHMSPGRLHQFEQTSLTDLQPGLLSHYLAALGGDLRHQAVINGEHFNLR
jgi:hypothetical protein